MKRFKRKWRVLTFYDKENDKFHEGLFSFRRYSCLWLPNGRCITIRTIDPITCAIIRRLHQWGYFIPPEDGLF